MLSLVGRMLIWLGGGALLAATAVDTFAVIGRHIGLPLTGSIEMMQPLVLVSGSVGLVVATLFSSHARVKLLVDRLNPRARAIADRGSDLLSVLFFAALLAGSTWIAMDMWSGHERSEMLGVPWRWMRLFANGCLVMAAFIALARLLRRPMR